MPTWGDILIERQQLAPRGPIADDIIRNKYLAALAAETKRPTIIYATKWTQPVIQGTPPDLLSITEEDLQAMMEVVHGLNGDKLDFILHSPGGSPVAAEAIVLYLRSKFNHIRVIVPHVAMSAATMLACAANEIVMGKHSFLGPIDPQFVLNTPLGQRTVPADAVREQFDLAIEECKDPKKATAWFPMLTQYGPDILVQCENASKLAKNLVKTWLKSYMFADTAYGANKARAIADWLGNHKKFNTHGRHICRAELIKHKMKIVPLEDDQKVQDLVLSVFHSVTQSFDHSPVVKLLANSNGRNFKKGVNFQAVQPVPMTGMGSRQPQPRPMTNSPRGIHPFPQPPKPPSGQPTKAAPAQNPPNPLPDQNGPNPSVQ